MAPANADLVQAGAVTAFNRATGAPVAKSDILAIGVISDDAADFGTAQSVTYLVRSDAGNPRASGTVDFYVSAGTIIGQSADYVIYGVTPQYLIAPGVAMANIDRVLAGQVTAFNRATGAPVAKTDIEASGTLSADIALFGIAQPISYQIKGDTGSPRAVGKVDFYVSEGEIIGQNADYVIYGSSPQYLVAAGVASANADLVQAGVVTAFYRPTGAQVAKGDIETSGTVSEAVADFGTAQTVTYTIRADTGNPRAIGTVDFYVSGGAIIGQNNDYVIYGATPTYLVAPGVAAANADLVLAGTVTAFRKQTGAPVAKGDIVAVGTLSADPSLFGTSQAITYSVRYDTGTPKASGKVDFYVAAGDIIGQNADYVIYGISPQYLVAPGVASANADLVQAGAVTAFHRQTGAPVAKTDIVAVGTLSVDPSLFGLAQPITYSVRYDTGMPKASGIVDFYTSAGSIIGQNAAYVIYGVTPQFLEVRDVARSNADLVLAGAVTAFNRATGAPVAKTDLVTAGTLSADPSLFGIAQGITYTVGIDPTNPQATASVDFIVSGGAIIAQSEGYVIFGATPQYLTVADVAAANADLVAAGQVTAYDKVTGAQVPSGGIGIVGSVSGLEASFGSPQAISYTVTADASLPKASGTVDFYVSGGAIIGQNADYVIYGATPTYLVAPGVAAANADLVAAGSVTAFEKATGTPVAKGDIVVTGSVSADVGLYGTAQAVTYTIRNDKGTPPAQGTVNFYVSGGTIIGESDRYIIYGTTPSYLVSAGVAAANADLVAAGSVTAFEKATGTPVAKGDIAVSGAVSADVAKYGTAQPVIYTVAIDPSPVKAEGDVDFYVSGGTIIGESANYIIYGVTPQYLVAAGVPAVNADPVLAGQVTAFNKATGKPVSKADIKASGMVSADVAAYGTLQPVTYTVEIDPASPKAQGTVDFCVSGGKIIGQNADYVIYGATPAYLVAPGVAAANADLVAAGQVTAFNKATGAKVAKGDIVATG
ncbi:MAG: hypothetical protein LBG81_02245, partial [Coriobacteriaceae bacterium]|nr:hypothetical protein [Coriobacteriaceae bacterium]